MKAIANALCRRVGWIWVQRVEYQGSEEGGGPCAGYCDSSRQPGWSRKAEIEGRPREAYGLARPRESGLFRGCVLSLFLERFPDGFVANVTGFSGFHLTGSQEP